MKKIRSALLLTSAFVMVAVLGGGLLVRVGAAESPYRQAVLFAEILGQVLDNYVDPVDADVLVEGALEGMLAGLDPNGAYLSPAEVERWKRGPGAGLVGPGLSVLKSARTLQVVAVEPDSAAHEAGIEVGDHIRSIDGAEVRGLSLQQARRLLDGEAGSLVRVEVLHPGDGFRREEIELPRRARRGEKFELRVRDGFGLLRIDELRDLPLNELRAELDDVRSRGVEHLLIDLRYVAEGGAREAAGLGRLFVEQAELRLRDRNGRTIDSVAVEAEARAWPGEVSVLVNGATAGGAEGLVLLLRERRDARVYGESTYGLGAEIKLFELENGAGLLVSSALWEVGGGTTWNVDGVEPDETVEGEGEDHTALRSSQLERVLERLKAVSEPEPARKAA